MSMRRDVKRQYKKDLKRIFIFILIMLPVLILASFCLEYFLHISGGWNMFLLVVIGGFGVLLMELIYSKVQKSKANKPKKKDPYAD